MKKSTKRNRLIAGGLALLMGAGIFLQNLGMTVHAESNSNLEGFQVSSINDPGTYNLTSNHFITTAADDGKVWMDKSVSNGTIYGVTPNDKNFNLVLSALGQSYSKPSVQFTTYKRDLAYDVVLVLDTSGSMQGYGQNMVNAVNTTITKLMEENPNNRVSVVLFPGANSSNSVVLLELDRYTAINGKYLELHYDDGDEYIRTVKGLLNSQKTVEIKGGTPTQIGFAKAEEVLHKKLMEEYGDAATDSLHAAQPGDLPRVPAIIMMSDGSPTYYYKDWEKPIGTKRNGTGNEKDETSVFYSALCTILTANSVKNKIRDEYTTVYADLYDKAITDYDTPEMKAKIAQIFTIGYGVPTTEDLTNYQLTQFVLNPDTNVTGNSKVLDVINVLNGEEGNKNKQIKYDSRYAKNYDYCDAYIGGDRVDDATLEEWFNIMLGNMVVQTEEYIVSNPLEDSNADLFNVAEDIIFEDYLGYKMEPKGTKQYVRYDYLNYTFIETSRTADKITYAWNGKDIIGNEVSGPVATYVDKNTNQQRTYSLYDVSLEVEKVNETYNGQTGYWKIVWKIPSPLLPIYNREDGFSSTRPIRLLCEVGLEDDVDPINDALKLNSNGDLATSPEEVNKYAFFTNVYDFANKEEMTFAKFNPGKDNPYYYQQGYSTDKPEGVDSPKRYVQVNFIGEKAQKLFVSGELANATFKNMNAGEDQNVKRFNFTYNDVPYFGSLSDITHTITGSSYDHVYTTIVTIPNVQWDYNGTTIKDGKLDVEVVLGSKIENGQEIFYLTNMLVNGKAMVLTDGDILLTNNNQQASCTYEQVPISGTNGLIESDEVLTVTHTELFGPNENGEYWIEDALNNEIKVKVDLISGSGSQDEYCEITLDGKKQTSEIYYERVDEIDYPSSGKQFKKGSQIDSLIGKLDLYLDEQGVPQGSITFKTNSGDSVRYLVDQEKFMEGVNEYYKATVKTDIGYALDLKLRIVKVGDKKAIYIEDLLASGSADAKYNIVGIRYSDFPIVDENNHYQTDLSITHTKNEAIDESANVTHTSDFYFEGNMNRNTGQFTGSLGNNGELSILADGLLAQFSMEKVWLDENGQPVNEDDLDIPNEIEVQLIQTGVIDGTPVEGIRKALGQPVTVTKANGWSYVWKSLPSKVIDGAGNVLQINGKDVEARYTIQETPILGWSNKTVVDETDVNKVKLVNTRTPITAIAVQKEFKDTHFEALADKSNWAVEVQLMEGNEIDGYVPYESTAMEADPNRLWIKLVRVSDTQATVELFISQAKTLEEANKDPNKVILDKQTVDFEVDENNNIVGDIPKATFVTAPGWSIGERGHSNYADKYQISVSLGTSTNGQKLKVSGIKSAYFYGNNSKPMVDNDATNGVTFNPDGSTSSNVGEESPDNWHMYSMNYQRGEIKAELTQENNWRQEWTGAQVSLSPSKLYYFKETAIIIDNQRFNVENGFVEVTVDNQKYKYKATNSIPTNTPNENGLITFTVANEDDRVDLTATKTWQGATNIDLNKAYVRLFTEKDGNLTPQDQVQEITGKGSATFSNLPRYDQNGLEINYVIKEVADANSKTPISLNGIITANNETYKLTQETKNQNTFNFTNTRSETLDQLTVTKIWQDAGDKSHRDSQVLIDVYRKLDSEPDTAKKLLGTITVSGDPNSDRWTGSLTNVEKFNEKGEKYRFSITERTLQNGSNYYLNPVYDQDKLTVTNTLKPGETTIHFVKTWIDGDDFVLRPDTLNIKLQQEVQGVWVDVKDTDYALNTEGENANEMTWTKPKFDETGNLINYRVVEEQPQDYTASNGGISEINTIGDYVITNTRADIDDKIEIKVTKVWAGNEKPNDQTSISFRLKADGEIKQTWTMLDGTETFSMPKYDKTTGKEIDYTVEEAEGEKYQLINQQKTKATDPETWNFELTNTVLTDIQVKKIWTDQDDDMHRRPTNIDVNLLADGQIIESTTLTDQEPNAWKHTWVNEPKYEYDQVTNEVKLVQYSVEEVTGNSVLDSNYTVTYNQEKFEITNTYDVNAQLTIRKEVEGTLADLNKDFTFNIGLKDGVDGQPLKGSYDYTKVTNDGQQNGTLTAPYVITLKDGESVTINLPADVYYEVEEAPVTGYQVQVTNEKGTIGNNGSAEVAFTNTYQTSSVTTEPLDFTKNLIGREWGENESFTFNFKGENGTEPMPNGTTNNVYQIVVTKPTNGVIQTFQIPAITFTQDDMVNATLENGYYVKTFTYSLTEIGEDTPNMDYDTTPRTVTFKVTDRKDGTLAVSVERPNKEKSAFVNTYTSQADYGTTGGLTLSKVLVGRDMVDQQFSFTLMGKDDQSKAKLNELGATNGSLIVKNTAAIEGVACEINPINLMTFKQNDHGKTFTYLISEDGTSGNGYTLDDTKYEVSIYVVDDGNGTITTTTTVSANGQSTVYENQPAIVAFANSYNASGAVQIAATKTLHNYPLKENDFSFKVIAKDKDNKTIDIIGSTPNKADGTIEFGSINYTTESLKQAVQDGYATKEGEVYTLHYKAIEEASNRPGVSVNMGEFDFTVVVTDNTNGQLTAVVNYPQGGINFVNTYTTQAEVKANIQGKKVLVPNQVGLSLPDMTGQFEFKLTGPEGAMPENHTARNDANGDIIFGEVTFTLDMLNDVTPDENGVRSKKFDYTVEEQPYQQNGIQNDSQTTRTISLTLTDDGKGNLSVQLMPETMPTFTFTNTYDVTPVDDSLTGQGNFTLTKVLEGKELQDGEFTFELVEQNGSEETVVVSAQNKADGTVTMPTIQFTAPGEYNYLLREVNGGQVHDGVTYDSQEYQVKAIVTDTTQGTLDVQWVVEGIEGTNIIFKNTYDNGSTPLSGETYLNVKKVFIGRNWNAKDVFKFELSANDAITQAAIDQGDVVMPTATVIEIKQDVNNIGQDNYENHFGDIVFNREGHYQFKIVEVDKNDANIIYSNKEYVVDVEVVDNNRGELVVTATTNGDAEFVNEYIPTGVTVPFSGIKYMSGRSFLEGDSFTFTIEALDGAPMVKDGQGQEVQSVTITPTTNQEATIGFGSITLTGADKQKSYTYLVKETAYNENGVTSDAGVIQVQVIVNYDENTGTIQPEVRYQKGSLNSQGELTNLKEVEGIEFTNTYAPNQDAVLDGKTNLSVQKTFSGKDWVNEVFTFTLEAASKETQEAIDAGQIMMPETSITISSSDLDENQNHTNHFGDITFKKTGTYRFKIKEVNDQNAGITYDAHEYIVEVIVTDNGHGALVANAVVVMSLGENTFVNTYTPANATVSLSGIKTMNGRDLNAEDKFNFKIEKGENSPENTPMPAITEVENTMELITFAPITYTVNDINQTFNYVITETPYHANGVSSDSKVVNVTVEVNYDTATGVIEPQVSYFVDGEAVDQFEFVNNYQANPTEKISLSGTKTVTPLNGNSYTMKGGEFHFNFIPYSTNKPSDPLEPKTLENDENGNIQILSDVSYTEVGTYKYHVSESLADVAGMTIDPREYDIIVVVEDDGQGQLTIDYTITSQNNEVSEITFDNKFDPQAVSAIITGQKVLDNQILEDGMFTFTLEPSSVTPNAPMPENTTAQNTAAGTFAFESITYTHPGTYKYVISEVDDGQPWYSYDESQYEVTVEVSYNVDSELQVVVSDMEKVNFHNVYHPIETTISLDGSKTITGRELSEGEFTFELRNQDGVVQTVSNDADGKFSFTDLTFDQVGTYNYTVHEVVNGISGVEYDATVYSVKVDVSDENGYLVAHVSYFTTETDTEEAVNGIEFENHYTPSPTQVQFGGLKKLDGREMQEGEFTFVLKDEDGQVLQTTKNTADGKIIFDAIKYDFEGTYTYTVEEVSLEEATITYDDTIYTIVVEVVDNKNGNLESSITMTSNKDEKSESIVFKNIYTEPEKPTDTNNTGDQNNIFQYAGLMGISLVGMIVALETKKRYRKI